MVTTHTFGTTVFIRSLHNSHEQYKWVQFVQTITINVRSKGDDWLDIRENSVQFDGEKMVTSKLEVPKQVNDGSVHDYKEEN